MYRVETIPVKLEPSPMNEPVKADAETAPVNVAEPSTFNEPVTTTLSVDSLPK